jgi:hypothetical protein
MATSTTAICDATGSNIAEVRSADPVSSELGLVVRTIDAPNTNWLATQVSVGTSATLITNGSPYTTRRRIKLKNLGPAAIYTGPSGVMTSTGYRLDAGEEDNFDLGHDLSIYGISPTTGNTVCVVEMG